MSSEPLVASTEALSLGKAGADSNSEPGASDVGQVALLPPEPVRVLGGR